jgi:4-amino-4-deoxy-L-arabinose transferase-like glycosyltransferase
MTTTFVARQASWTGRDLPAIVDFATRSHARAMAVLVLFSLLMFLPGFFQIPPMDRDESRFAQASKQMVETGDYVDIRFLDEVRYKKPVGIYWLQAGAVKTARVLGVPDALTTIWVYRIPSLLGAIGTVLLTYWAALAFVGRRAAVLAALMMAGSVLLGVEARLAKTDAVLLFTSIAAMGAMGRVYMRFDSNRRGDKDSLAAPMIFWTTLAAGFLIKGPLILLFAGLTIGTLAVADRSLQWVKTLRPALGVPCFLLLVLPWFLAITFRSGSGFFAGSLGHDMLGKVASGQESHGAPPGLYLLLFWVTFWPGAVLAGLATPAVWMARRERGTRFLLAWLVPAWIVFELVVTKLPHYVLPLYPAIAILIAGTIERGLLSRNYWLERGTLLWLLIPVLLTGAAIAALVAFDGGLGLAAWPFAAAAAAFGLMAWWFYRADGAERSLLRALVSSLMIAVSVYAITLPGLTRLFPSVALADIVRAAECRHPVVAAAGYHEPSFAFLAGSSTVLTNGAGAANFLAEGGCHVALVESRAESEFLERARDIRLRYSMITTVEGLNYSNGRLVKVTAYKAEPVQ